jgi:ribose transport system substrate-binding protein
MRSNTVRIFLLLACLALLLVLAAGCGSSSTTTTVAAPTTTAGGAATTTTAAASTGITAPPASTKPFKIGVFVYNSTPYARVTWEASQAEAQRLGGSATMFNPENDAKLQATQMQDAIASGEYQGFVVYPNDGVRLQPLVKEAADKGIKVVVCDASLASPQDQLTLYNLPGVMQTIGFGLTTNCQEFADETIKAVDAKVGKGNPATVAIQPGLTNFPQDVIRTQFLQDAFNKTGYIKSVVMPQGEYSTPGGQKSALDFFQANKDVDVIVSYADQMAMGDVTALQQLGLTAGKDVYIVAGGAAKEAMEGIQAGTWFGSIGNYPAKESQLAVDTIVSSMQGNATPELIEIWKVTGCPPAIDKDYLTANPDFKPDWAVMATG